MSLHNISFRGEIRKTLSGHSLLSGAMIPVMLSLSKQCTVKFCVKQAPKGMQKVIA